MKDIHDVIKHAKFDDDRFRGSGVVAGQISAFPIDFAGRPFDEISIDCVVFAVSVYFSIHVNSLLYYHASPMGAGGVMFVTCPSALSLIHI